MAYCSSESLLDTKLYLSCTGCGQIPPFDLPEPPEVPVTVSGSDSLLHLLWLLLVPVLLIVILCILFRKKLKGLFEKHCRPNKVGPDPDPDPVPVPVPVLVPAPEKEGVPDGVTAPEPNGSTKVNGAGSPV
ncbi:uncharacterized protein [Ptychodera flava]|uniref:uncharacterized protein n=1 Tax=Ptychodera flava TaxID=63121 RepID=UPI003969FA94